MSKKVLRSYPKVWSLGHPAIAALFDGPVVVQEKVDGSQMSFGVVGGELFCRSKGARLYLDSTDKLFRPALDTAIRLFEAGRLVEGWTYRGEAFCRPKHNTLAYDRAPAGGVILFDIDTGLEQRIADPGEVARIAEGLGLEMVPTLYRGVVESADQLAALLGRTSVLGGCQVEGVVAKNYCVTPEQRTLTADLQWVPIGELSEGDRLLACTEHGDRWRGRQYTESVVQHAERATAEVFEVGLSDGTVLRATGNHPWLVRPSERKTEYVWRETEALRGTERIRRILPTWISDNSYEAGYIAGVFDGEGHMIHRQLSLRSQTIDAGFSQKEGVVADTMLRYLTTKGFDCSSFSGGSSTAAKYRLRGGKPETLRLLGSIRPQRLLGKLDINELGGSRQRGPVFLNIEYVRHLGRREIVELQTSSATYFVEGFASHNSRFGEDGKMLMGKHVSEAFKEVHRNDWAKRNPTRADVVQQIVDTYRSEARWRKAVHHIREAGELESSPRDIGRLMREVPADVRAECEHEIKDALFAHFWPQIQRGITAGLPQWYKEQLAAAQFAETPAEPAGQHSEVR